MPPSQLRFQKPAGLIFFMVFFRVPSEKARLPVKSIFLTFALGPSSMTKETCCPAAPIGFASIFTVAKGRPFSASISLITASTRRAFATS